MDTAIQVRINSVCVRHTQAEIAHSMFPTRRNRRKPTGTNVNASQNQPVVVSQQDQGSAQTRKLEEDSDSKKKQESTARQSGYKQDDGMNVGWQEGPIGQPKEGGGSLQQEKKLQRYGVEKEITEIRSTKSSVGRRRGKGATLAMARRKRRRHNGWII